MYYVFVYFLWYIFQNNFIKQVVLFNLLDLTIFIIFVNIRLYILINFLYYYTSSINIFSFFALRMGFIYYPTQFYLNTTAIDIVQNNLKITEFSWTTIS